MPNHRAAASAPAPSARLRLVLAAGALAVGALASAPAALAQTVDEQAILQQFCARDYLKFCNGIDPNGKEVDACFQRNMDNLSPDCRTSIANYMKRNPKGGHPTN